MVSGKLTAGGKALGGATVAVSAWDVTARNGLGWRQAPGTTPVNAASAVVGIRAGVEGGCICSGSAGATFGSIYYLETTTGYWQDISPVSLPVAGAPDSIRTVQMVPGQTISTNLAQFPVDPGVPFELDMPLAATGNAAQAGYVAVIFLDASGREVGRTQQWFTPQQLAVGSATTDANGQYQVAVPAALAATFPELHVSYAGGTALQASTSIIPTAASGSQLTMPALAQPMPTTAQLAGQRLTWFTPREDFLNLLVQGQTWSQLQPQWATAQQHTQVILLNFSALLAIPDSVLPRILQDMDNQHLALALEIEPTNWYHEVSCGAGVESYSDPATANQVVYKLLKAGGKLSAVTMDEPLWYGHYYTGAKACNSSIQDEARRAAVIVKIFTAAFPNLIVGDIEPFPEMAYQPTWQADFAAWVQAFNSAVGTPLSFLQLDFDWDQGVLLSYGWPNPPAIESLVQTIAPVARGNGLQLGMIYNGNGSASSDAIWIWEAQQHINAIEASGVRPDQVIFRTWAASPAQTIPETTPTTLTSLIDYFFQNYH